ncbi:hypothetical protein KKG48_03700 [Patescibacteria group bacterium]|nr:hypothetical protein [Patescibacteria group bacterium]
MTSFIGRIFGNKTATLANVASKLVELERRRDTLEEEKKRKQAEVKDLQIEAVISDPQDRTALIAARTVVEEISTNISAIDDLAAALMDEAIELAAQEATAGEEEKPSLRAEQKAQVRAMKKKMIAPLIDLLTIYHRAVGHISYLPVLSNQNFLDAAGDPKIEGRLFGISFDITEFETADIEAANAKLAKAYEQESVGGKKSPISIRLHKIAECERMTPEQAIAAAIAEVRAAR